MLLKSSNFQGYLREIWPIIRFIDERWVSPGREGFDSFRQGIKYINMLIEGLVAYSEEAQKITEEAYAEAVFAAPMSAPVGALADGKAGFDPTTALTVRADPGTTLALIGTSDAKERALKGLASAKQAGANSIPGKLSDLKNTMKQIDIYLDLLAARK